MPLMNVVKLINLDLFRNYLEDVHLKFLVTSRPYNDIQNCFQRTKYFPSLLLKGENKNDQIHQEIDLVVKERIKELA
ncbi:hypothetical protein HAV15_008741 [Penicillium sp. str. |nr:hypothetical protein HAV15_008741 [Penicillium sp. str. \